MTELERECRNLEEMVESAFERYGNDEEWLAQILLETVPEVIVVADHTKFGRACTAHIAPVDRADVIVTGRDAPDATLWELAELGVKIVLA